MREGTGVVPGPLKRFARRHHDIERGLGVVCAHEIWFSFAQRVGGYAPGPPKIFFMQFAPEQ